MAEIPRFSGCSDWIELAFVEREQTPSELMQLGIRFHLAGLSLSNTISKLEKFGVHRSRKVIHDWVQEVNLQLASGASPDHVAVDEMMIQINERQYWLYAAVDSETKISPYSVVYDYNNHHLAAALNRTGLRFQTLRHGNRNAVERVFREIKRRTSSFSNSFSYIDPATAETRLQLFAVWWNSLN